MAFPARESEFPQFAAPLVRLIPLLLLGSRTRRHQPLLPPLSEKSRPGASRRPAPSPPPGAHTAAAAGGRGELRFKPPTATAGSLLGLEPPHPHPRHA